MRWLICFLVVVSNPYENLNYERVNVYTISSSRSGIEVMLPEESSYGAYQEQTEEQETIFIDYSDLYFLQRQH